MKKFQHKLISVLTILIIFFSSSKYFSQSVKLKFIETSDVHGAIFPYNFTEGKSSHNSLAQVYTYVKKERADKTQDVILLDNGDILQGDPSVYYYNFEKTDTTHLLASVMNFMKYDAGTVGNHDIETGHAVYDKFNTELNFPWLAANAVNTKTDEPYFPPYLIIRKNGVKIAILGMITPGIPNWLPRKIWSGIDFQDMILTAKKWVPIIIEKEKPDLLIGLFHAGIEYNYDNQNANTPRNENAAKLVAEQVPGFDIVFVGHDHHGWNLKVKNSDGDSVLILGTTSRANDIAEAIVDMKFDTVKNIWNKTFTSSIVDMKNILPDENFLNTFKNEFDIVKDYVSQPIGEFTKTISAKNSLFGNSAFVDLIHKIQLELTHADISFTAPLSMSAKIDSGKVYIKDMFDLYRYENLLYTMELTGKEVKDYLEYSYDNWFNTMKDENDNLLLLEKDDNGNLVLSKRGNVPLLKYRYYNFDSAEGIKYIVDVTKPNGEKINILSMEDGTPFNLNIKYKVAINSYRGNGGGGHLTEGAGIPKDELANRVINSTEKDLRYYMMKWIKKQKVVFPIEDNNWSIIPTEWVIAAKIKDYELMFGKNNFSN
jgi:2',3'-cyclic-nucleotide 2'-phosphodiesterase / 3'-nucleotidase